MFRVGYSGCDVSYRDGGFPSFGGFCVGVSCVERVLSLPRNSLFS